MPNETDAKNNGAEIVRMISEFHSKTRRIDAPYGAIAGWKNQL